VLPGLEYKSIALFSPPSRSRTRLRADSGEEGRRSRESSSDTRDRVDLTNTPSASEAGDSQTASDIGAKKETIVLHVLDEHRKINRDFVCQKDLLLREMKYFRNYLVEGVDSDDIDISVHCDVKIFEWLVRYLHQPEQVPHLGKLYVADVAHVYRDNNSGFHFDLVGFSADGTTCSTLFVFYQTSSVRDY